MKKIILTITSVALLFSSCSGEFKDVTDFTTVENPNLSEASVVGQPNSATIWANGIDREISRTFNEIWS